MKRHEHPPNNPPEEEPAQDEVAKKAYAIYLKEGRPQGHAEQNWLEAEAQSQHVGSDHPDHHAHMAADLRKRFWISLALTLPILLLSPLLQKLVGLREAIRFPGDLYVLFGLSSTVFWYGGWRFLRGLFKELTSWQPGMMTLVAVAITTAYLYSSTVVFGLTGKMFFQELATLVDIMLLGHWIERVSWSDSKVFFNLSRVAVRQSPEYRMESSPTRDYEAGLHLHYDRLGYWIEEPAAEKHFEHL